MRKTSVRKTKDDLLKDYEDKLNKGYNLADYFLTIGVDPDIFLSPWLYESPIEELNTTYSEQLKPKILNKFPSFEKKNIGIDDTIIHHCFPLGFKVQEFTIEPEFKVFYIILDNNNFSEVHQFKYAVCLLFYEPINNYMKLHEKYFNINNPCTNKINNIRTSMNLNHKNNSFYLEQNNLFNFNDDISNYSTKTYNNNKEITKRVNNLSVLSYNFMSEYSQKETNMTSFFNNKYFKKYYIPKCICLLSLYPFITELTRIIKKIYKYSKLENVEIPLEKIINNLILEVPIPPRGLYSIMYQILDETILLRNSKLNELFYISFEFNLLFTRFNVEQVLIIFQYLMLGTKLIFFSSKIEFLTPIILSSLILLFPFKFPFTVVSILPKESYYLIDNITPEIFGINEIFDYSFFSNNDIEINDHLLIIDIDRNNIIPYKSKNKGELPPLPKQLKEKLSDKLKSYISSIHKNMRKDIKEPIARFQSVIRNFFLEFQIELLKDYQNYLNSNIYKHPLEKPFKVKKFLNSVPKADHLFYEKFIETQLFNDYILKRMAPKDKKEQTEVLFFEEKIFLLKEQRDKIIFLNSNSFEFKNEIKVQKVNSIMEEEILNYYINEQNNKKFLLDGISLDILKTNEGKLIQKSKSVSFNSDMNLNMNVKKVSNENKILFNYIIFPKLNNDLYFKTEIKNYLLDLSIYNEIKNMNSDLISNSHLSRVELKTNGMTNFVYILWLKVWANSFYYHDKIEQKYRYLQMLKVFDNISQHEMNVISNLFQGLIKANVDEDLIFYLYNKILQLKLSPSFDIYNAIKNKIRKKTKNSAMPTSEINKYLLNRGQIHINKYDIDKKSFRKRTMKSIYDMYLIKEKVSFVMDEICNNCDRKIDIYNFQKNINNTNDDIVWAKCPFCGFDYLPKLKVIFGDELNKNNKLSRCTSIVDEVTLYSPKTLKMNFFDNSSIDVDNLKINYNPVFWNLIWYFKIAGLPFDFILPYEGNIFFKRKIKNHGFFKVKISDKDKDEYFEKKEKIPDKIEENIQNHLPQKIEPKMQLNNNLNYNTNPNSKNMTIFPKNDNKYIKANTCRTVLNNIGQNINNLKISNKQTNDFLNKSFYNISLSNKDKKLINIKQNVIKPNPIPKSNSNKMVTYINIPNNSNQSISTGLGNINNNINKKDNIHHNNNVKNINNNIPYNNINLNITTNNINNKIIRNKIMNLNNFNNENIYPNNVLNNSHIINNRINKASNSMMINSIINRRLANNSMIIKQNTNPPLNNKSALLIKINNPNTINGNVNNNLNLNNNNIIFNNIKINGDKPNINNYQINNKVVVPTTNRINLKKNEVIPKQNLLNNNIIYNYNPYQINGINNNIPKYNHKISLSYGYGINYNNYLLNNNKILSNNFIPIFTSYIYK